MIKVLRIDDRLMHAQVTFGWAQNFNVKGILIISDHVANDPTMKMAAEFAKPEGMKLWIKTVDEGIAVLEKLNGFSYNSMVLVENPAVALKVCQNCDLIKYVNMGGQRVGAGRKSILDTIWVSDQDLLDLKSIEDLGVTVEVQKMITDPGYPLKNFL
ncbi:MAG: PTS sugar transporter subunit IIB [Firmicutes bacterium]|nr:PTS sugar transporter subunit IIB [Candidatus Colivicinus equi]MDO4940059.1 PTS sugar transporter subunit IIB [Erysipelotrichaceae bacterium]